MSSLKGRDTDGFANSSSRHARHMPRGRRRSSQLRLRYDTRRSPVGNIASSGFRHDVMAGVVSGLISGLLVGIALFLAQMSLEDQRVALDYAREELEPPSQRAEREHPLRPRLGYVRCRGPHRSPSST